MRVLYTMYSIVRVPAIFSLETSYTQISKIYNSHYRDVNGPGGPRAGPENPGPRALRAETGLKWFYLRVLCATENSNFC